MAVYTLKMVKAIAESYDPESGEWSDTIYWSTGDFCNDPIEVAEYRADFINSMKKVGRNYHRQTKYLNGEILGRTE